MYADDKNTKHYVVVYVDTQHVFTLENETSIAYL